MFDVKKMGEIIKELRGTLSQAECAKLLGISRGALSFYENGERKPDADVIYTMSRKFGVPSDYILGLSGVSCYDTELNAVCKYTGLSEEAVEALESHRDRIVCKTNDERQDSTSILCVENNDIVSTVLTSNEFWNIIYYLCLLKQSTKEYSANKLNTMLNTTPNEWEKEIHLMVDCLTIANVYRYSITQEIEKISDMFDKREDENNADHNPKKE